MTVNAHTIHVLLLRRTVVPPLRWLTCSSSSMARRHLYMQRIRSLLAA